MRRKNRAAAALAMLFCFLGTGIARAEFIRDYRDWQRLSAPAQQGYVAGALDQNGVASAGDDRQLVIRSAAELCLGQAGNTVKAIADGVSDAYRKEPKLARQPPFLVAWYVAARRCKSAINDELAHSGLDPLDAESILSALKVDVARSR